MNLNEIKKLTSEGQSGGELKLGQYCKIYFIF